MPPKKNPTRRLITLLIGLIIVVVAVAVIGKMTGLFGSTERSTLVEAVDVEIRTVTQVVTASGKIQPETEVKISPDVSGEIIELPINEGDFVRKGDLLVRIKPDFYQAQVEQSEASVLQAKATESARRADVLNAELEYNRQKELFSAGAISKSDFDTAENRYQTAKANLEAAQYSVQINEARLSEMRENLSRTIIHAPIEGTISILNVELGERVVGTTQMTGTEMMRVARLDQMELEVDVNENDVVNVALGDTAAVEIDAYQNRTFRGVVTEIANSARTQGQGTQEQITNFPVKIRILDAHNTVYGQLAQNAALAGNEITAASETPNFRPGMSGTVDIFTETLEGTIAVPIQAVTVRDFAALAREERREERRAGNGAASGSEDGSAVDEPAPDNEAALDPTEEDLRRVVFVMADGKAEMVEVKTGISDDTHVVISSGLTAGQKIITGPYRAVSRTLRPGDTVEVRSDDDLRPVVLTSN